MIVVRCLLMLGSLLLVSGCRTTHPPLPQAAQVDLERFMGDWYVIAAIPTFIEQGAHKAMESYAMNADGTIATTFRFRKGSFDGPEKVYTPRGFVRDDPSNAVWGMRFIWPFKADYRIMYVSENYGETVIGRVKRDYVWIMARTPSIPDAELERLMGLVEAAGYPRDRVVKVPQVPAVP